MSEELYSGKFRCSVLFCSERGTAESSLSHTWLKADHKDAKKIATKRLKSFRARRRWLVSA